LERESRRWPHAPLGWTGETAAEAGFDSIVPATVPAPPVVAVFDVACGREAERAGKSASESMLLRLVLDVMARSTDDEEDEADDIEALS